MGNAKKWHAILLGGILGACLFVAIYGVRVLDVTYDAWLLNKQDLNQHYIGWKAFCNSNWQFPLGMNNGLTYPSSISVLYTDSIPLFAIACKAIRRFLPETFQYFGLFGLFCFILNGMAASWIASKFHKNLVFTSIMSIIMTAMPVVFQRMFVHTALSAMFLLLFSYGIWLHRESFQSVKKAAICWAILGCLCVLIQSYYLFIVGGILCGYLLQELLETKNWKKLLVVLGTFFVVVLATTYVIGGFSGSPSMGAEGFGLYSMNLNTFYNPQGYSWILPDLPIGPGQYEGVAYMGLGVLLLSMIALVYGLVMLIRKISAKSWKQVWKANKMAVISWGIVVLVFGALSLTNIVEWNDTTICSINLPAPILNLASVVRSSGRFSWCILYFVLIFSMYLLTKVEKKELILGISVVVLILQVVDLSPKIKEFHDEFSQNKEYSKEVLVNPEWDSMQVRYNKVMFYPVPAIDSEAVKGMYYEFANMFVTHGAKMNNFYFSRPFDECASTTEEYIKKKLRKNTLNERTLYVLNPVTAQTFAQEEGMHLYQVDQQIIGTMQKEKLPEYKCDQVLSKNMPEIVLDMVDAENSSRYMTEGWYGYENGCAYAREQAHLKLYTRGVKKAGIQFSYMPMEGEQPTLVYVDAQYIGTISKTEEGGVATIGIPDQILKETDVHDICLVTDTLVGGQVSSSDEVGMALKKVTYQMYQ